MKKIFRGKEFITTQEFEEVMVKNKILDKTNGELVGDYQVYLSKLDPYFKG